jgi:hypothetical protein
LKPGLPDGIFQTKNPNLGKFGRVLHTMKDVGKFDGKLVCFTAMSYILWPFGTFWYIFPVLVCRTKKNLATLLKRKPCVQTG